MHNGEHLYSTFPYICAQSVLRLIITPKDLESYLILSQLPRNNDKNVNNNTYSNRNYTARLLLKRAETSILTIYFTVWFEVPKFFPKDFIQLLQFCSFLYIKFFSIQEIRTIHPLPLLLLSKIFLIDISTYENMRYFLMIYVISENYSKLNLLLLSNFVNFINLHTIIH